MTDTLTGCDAESPFSQAAAEAAKAAGMGFVLRYYSRDTRKNLSVAEAAMLSAAGFKIGTVWEAEGDVASTFTATQGIADAHAALALAKAIGQPPGSVIYVAVDFDATAVQVEDRIVPYFQSWDNIVSGYQLGVYGSGAVCQRLLDLKLVKYAWLAQSTGWRGTAGFSGWHVRQGVPQGDYGMPFPIDPDEAQIDFGGWALPVAPTPAPVPAPVSWPRILSAGMVGTDVSRLQRLLCAAGYQIACDGEFGPATQEAVEAFQEARGLDEEGVAGAETVTALGSLVKATSADSKG